jgi:GAF domain-containing protein/HAMP domain-containing protein
MERKREVKPGNSLLSLRTSLALNFTWLALVLIGMILAFSYFRFQGQVRQDIKQRLINIAAIAASQQDGDAFIGITSAQDPAFEQIRLQNMRMRATSADIAFIYTMRYDEDGLFFVVDAVDPADPDASAYGDRYLEPGPVLVANYAIMSGPIVESEFYTDEYGTFLSAYAPFYTSDGQPAGIIGVDIRADDVKASERRALALVVTALLISLPIVALAGWFFGTRVANPIRDFTDIVSRISQGELNYRPALSTGFLEIDILKQQFFSMADQLQRSIENLEEKVLERTRQLEIRSEEVRTAAQIVRDVSLSNNVDELLDQTAKYIRERFSYYHVGIFLVDDNKEYAVLAAAGGDAGRLLLANKHKLRIGEVGIVGYVTKTGEPRITLDVGRDAVHFKNPLLPYTRSEMALPLVVQGRILGAIDIQSDKVNAFDTGDIAIMQILTDQLSVAMEKTRLVEETARATQELEATAREYTARVWKSFMRQTQIVTGYRFGGLSFEPLTAAADTLEPAADGKLRVEKSDDNTESTLIVPVILRGQTIGLLNLRFSGTEISEEVSRLAQEAAGRLALALENARLVDEARRLAQRERQVNLISAQMQQSADLESLLKNTVRELGNTLGAPNTFIQLGKITPPTLHKKKKA